MSSSVPLQCIHYTNSNCTKQSRWPFKTLHLVMWLSGSNLCNGFPLHCNKPSVLFRAHRACSELVMLDVQPHLLLSWYSCCPPTLSFPVPWNAPNQYRETLTNCDVLGNWGISKTSFMFPLHLVESLSSKYESSVALWKLKSAKNGSKDL